MLSPNLMFHFKNEREDLGSCWPHFAIYFLNFLISDSHWTPNSLIPVSWCRSNYTFKLVSWVPAYPDVPKFEAYEGTAIPPFKRNSEGSNFLLALKQGPKGRGKWPTTRSGIPIWRKPWSSGTDIFHQEKGGRLVRRPTYQQDCDQIPQRVRRWIIIMQI